MPGRMRYVQVELDNETYARLVGIAGSRGASLRHLVNQALAECISKYEGETEKDSILSLIGSVETKERDWSTRKDWRA